MTTELNPDGAVSVTEDVLAWTSENPIAVAAIVILIIVVLVVRGARNARPIQLDQQRMFSAQQRSEAKRRAGGRCEHSFLGIRCRRAGEHADHIFPHSRGGATAMSNCQSLCQHHNLAKSAKVPSPFYVRRLVARRRAYFPTDAPVEVEWRIGIAA